MFFVFKNEKYKNKINIICIIIKYYKNYYVLSLYYLDFVITKVLYTS